MENFVVNNVKSGDTVSIKTHSYVFILVVCLLSVLFYTAGTTWSTDSSTRTSSWLVLRNLTPQVQVCSVSILVSQFFSHFKQLQRNSFVRVFVPDRWFHSAYTVHAARPSYHVPPQPDTGQRRGALQLQGRSCQGSEVPAHVRL